MALIGIMWLPGFDFDRHITRDIADWPELLGFFLAFDDDPAVGVFTLDSLPAGTDITGVTFRPRFEGAPSNHGVAVDTATGAITLTPAPPPTLHNFLLEIEVTHTSSNLPSPWQNGVRVHVHDSLLFVWLTPDPLVGRQGARNVRFTLLGTFDDAVTGEITDWTLMGTGATDPVTGGPLHFLQLRSSDAATVGVEPDDQTIEFLGAAGASATITAEFGGSPIATAVARCEAPWSTPVQATFVDGAGEGRRDDVPNILFLPDGFDSTERNVFEQLVRHIVRNGLARNDFLAPYNHLSRSINYWSCWIPSPGKGVTVLSELGRLRVSGANFRGTPLDPPSRPSPTAAQWTLEELIHEVGLPVPTQESLSRSALLSHWQAVYGAHVTQARVSDQLEVGGARVEVWNFWRRFSRRLLLNEVSSTFGVAVGGRHSANCVGSFSRLLVPNPKRLDDEDLDAFLRALQFRDPGSGALVTFGERWAPVEDDPPGPRRRGKDAGLVCVVARTPFWSGTNRPGVVLCIGLGEEQEHRFTSAATSGLADVLPQTVRARAPLSTVHTVAHEVAHSFHCDDEYAGDCSHGQPGATADFGNTQLPTENGLLSASPTQAIDGSRIKWRWPRIAKAGVLRAQPAPDPAQPHVFTIQLRPGHSAFAVDDVVRLRARPLPANLVASFRLRVTVVTADAALGDTITAEQIEGLPFAIVPAGFPAGSVLFKPVYPPGPPPGDDVLLIHPDVEAHITSTDGPLSAPPGSPTRDCPTDFLANPDPHLFNIQFATNLPASLQPGTRAAPTWGSWIVGLYEGGAGFPCGIFHPTGACAMRSGAVPRRTLSRRLIVPGVDTQGRRIPPPGTLYKFCPVCRYLLVDAIDPTKHPQIDAEYDRIYPR